MKNRGVREGEKMKTKVKKGTVKLGKLEWKPVVIRRQVLICNVASALCHSLEWRFRNAFLT